MSEGITPSSGNVFADIGLPYPEEALAKSQLAYRIATIIKARGLSPEAAANLLGTSQSKISLIKTGQLGGITIDRLMRFLTALDEEVEIIVRHRQGPFALHVALG
ncbi:MAG TPA: helix-turn-helix transcriptional regulator [Ktedonobacteraceae bacterium]|nr:helix-turn-helix transcriptional regulator [Ktedonobacteraceae bacterium]